ncbi:MAG TPA: energy transducer TonB [Bacteroidales bacterium]|jgi:protein TonB|nr:energy transducer TonB [Bacteroidales bacterium]HOS73114.1 energy transducer TonB [Bacteroidales bacterium]HQH24373.1 energy transducer TonB [Bacteroidales bacterium]HQJ81494.1 energy transducer TonB [Bacteroidales bacterium]
MALFNGTPGFDEIVFASRNRDYGAYKLRKRYFSALLTGLISAILIACIVVLIPFFSKPPEDEIFPGGGRYISIMMDRLDAPSDQIYVPPPPAAPSRPVPKAAQEIVRYVAPEVIDTIIPSVQTPLSTDELIIQSGEGTDDNEGFGFGDEIFDGHGSGGYYTDEPFFLVEVMPSFRGGDINRFREWVQKRTNYPQEALDKKIQGRIFLTFIVEADGAVSNVTVVKGVDPLIDDEAVKAIAASPKWTPGLQRGQPVRVRYSLWLSFVI